VERRKLVDLQIFTARQFNFDGYPEDRCMTRTNDPLLKGHVPGFLRTAQSREIFFVFGSSVSVLARGIVSR
jgi:hypothetical protein